jgi:MFS family permease
MTPKALFSYKMAEIGLLMFSTFNLGGIKMNLIKRNIKIDYVYRFVSSMDITAAIWVLYLSHKGLNLIEIGLLESIFHGTSLIFEVPTGAIADLMGRKKTLILGRICSTFSALLMLISNSFWGFALSFVISALSYNLNSGSEEALVYDSLKALNQEEEYTKINGNINFIIEISQALAVFLGGMLSEISFTLSYSLAAVLSLGAFSVSLCFYEVDLGKKKHESVNFSDHFKQCFETIKSNKKLVLIMLFFSLLFTIGTTTHFFSQQYFYSYGFSKAQIAIIFVINGFICALGAKIAYWVESKLGRKGVVLILPIMNTLSLIGLALTGKFIAIIFFFMFSFIIAMYYPISSNYINELIPSAQRATLISVQSICFSSMMLLFFPLVGFIGDKISLSFGFLLGGIVILLLTLLFTTKFVRSSSFNSTLKHIE